MGSCGDLSELHEPLDQDAVEQHSSLKNVENTVSEENPCVEDGEGVIGSLEDTCGQQGTSGEECQNDNVGCGVGRKVDAVSVGWEVESVSQDENAVGLEAPKLLGEEGGVSGGSLNENVHKIDDSNVSYAGENGLGTEDCRLGNSMESIERSSSSKTSGSLEESHEREEVGMEKNVDLIETETEIENRIFTPAECEILSEKRRCTNPDGCQLEEVPKFVEEKNEGATYKEVENSSQISPAEVETSYSKEGFPCLSPDDSSEKCSSPHSCRPSYVTESESSKRLDLSHCSVNRTVAINFDGLVECLRQTEAQENEAGDDCVCIPKCHDMLSPSSQNCSWLTKTGRKTQTKRAARNRRNKAGASDSHGSNESVFKVSRRKRSSLLRSARSSSWGLTGIFSELFVPRNEVGLTKKRNQGPGKAKVGQGSAKQKINQTSKSSEKSSTKASAPLNPIRLKIKVGKETIGSSLNLMVPEMAYGSSYADPVISDNRTRTHVGSMLETSNATDEYITCKETTDKQLQCSGTILHHVERHSDVSVADACLEKDLDGTLGSERSPESAAEDHLQVSSSLVFDKLGVTIEKSDTSPGTSPDSEVINSVPDSQVCAVSRQDFPNGSLPVNAFDAPVITNEKNGGKNKHGYTDNHSLGDGSPGFASAKQRKPKKKPGRKHSKGDNLPLGEIPIVSVIPNSLSNSDISRELSMEQLPSSNEMEIGTSREAFRRERSAEEKISRSLDTGLVELESQMSKDLLSSAKSKRRSKNSGGKRERSKNCGTGKTKKGNAKKKVVKDKVKDKSLCLSNRVVSNAEHNVETGNHVIDDNQELTGGNNIDLANLSNSDVETSNIVDQSLPAENAWVRCDDCYKWRRIPVALVDSIGQSQWFCKENVDIKFADCSIPQEKSNEEINVELGISDAEEDVCDMPSNNKGAEDRVVTVPKEYEFTHITTNQFLYRNRKTQTIDEIMVCHCKLPVDGKLGCGEECLNRMLNIECIQGTCPCGDLCSNQQFQNRNYAKMRWARCGKKGFGLRMEEDISEGQFLIEYVGEVLDMNTYEARQKEYASQGHKHFYFMTLNGSEVIDACAKGNLGRFINHSCDPNCRTEKWVVNGEICIGLFAIRDIKKDEEVTFDYNFVRVFGAAAKECYCGSRQCRGYIGGDPTSCEVVHQVDSDEEFPEPVMVGQGEDRIKFKDMASDIRSVLRMESAEIEQKDQDEMSKPPTAADKLEVASDKEYSIEKSVSTDSHLHDSLEVDNLKENHPLSTAPVTPSTEAEMTCKSWSTVLLDMQETISTTTDSTQISDSPHKTLDKLSHNGIVLNKKLKSTAPEHKRVFVKSRFLIKKPRQTGSVKKVKVGTNPPKVNKAQIMTSKSQAPFTKPKGHPETISDGHFETVEGKLNDLLDTDGGISKRKDAAKGYLKLLLLTAATGASGHGEAIQSNRDLSMILDALLKTRSRAVLMDIISKNGLQMLHNMMKQYRGDFRKIPILRKLLRVLEYLAVREILSLELINGGPPRPGMESFQESMLSLTEHNDKQVHQIARNFRDKWIPRHLRRYNHTEKDDMRAEFHKGLNCSKVLAQHNHWRDQAARPTDAITCSAQSNCGTSPADSVATPESNCETRASDPTKARKRKSRWDQDAPVSRSFKHDEKKIKSGGLQTSESSEMSQKVSDTAAGKTGKEDSYCPNCVRNYHQYNEETSASDRRHNLSDDVPPGFSSPINLPLVSSSDRDLFKQNTSEKGPLSEVIGHVQRRFNSRMPVSYGIPLPIMEQFGSPCDDAIDGMNIVPGMPFFPFPPIPPMPHHRKEALSSVVDDPIVNDESKSSQTEARDSTSTTCNPSEDNRSFTGAKRATPDWDMPGPNCQHGFKRAKGSMNELGRRYFRQQKWIKGPPWLKRHNQWGFN